MSGSVRYVVAAFNARPFGMVVPPNWLALGAFALLGAFLNPGFWLIGVGLEAAYLLMLVRSERFRRLVDAFEQPAIAGQSSHQDLVQRLEPRSKALHAAMQEQGAELVGVLDRQGATAAQLGDVRQLVWLHLKLLIARDGLVAVLESGSRDRQSLADQEADLAARLGSNSLGDDLRRSLEQRLEVIGSRRKAQADAAARRELVEAELERLRQQMSLVREQALLATDEGAVARSVDALSASLNEANRWLRDQRELFAGLESLSQESIPSDILRRQSRQSRKQAPKEAE